MKLKAWLKKEKMSQVAFAKLIESDQAHVSDLVNGKVLPSLLTVSAIAEATKGKVEFTDWIKKSKRVS